MWGLISTITPERSKEFKVNVPELINSRYSFPWLSPHMVSDFILDRVSKADIVSVYHVSKGFHSLTMSLIYGNISWPWDIVPMSSILRLLRAILQNRELALCIQHVKILYSPDSPYDRTWKTPWHETDWDMEQWKYIDIIQRAQAIVNEAKFPDAEREWVFARRLSLFIRHHFPLLAPLRHALFSVPKGTLSIFNYLSMIYYGGNVRQSDYRGDWGHFYYRCYPSCAPWQFMAWFYLPSVRSLFIWLRSTEGLFMQNER